MPPPPTPAIRDPWECSVTDLPWFKKTMMHVRNHCSFVILGVRPSGLCWHGTSSIDHLQLHMDLPCAVFETFRVEGGALPCVELNMLQFYRIIKRARSFQYQRIRIGVHAPTSVFTPTDHTRPQYHTLYVRFETGNKHDVFHIRCLASHLPPPAPTLPSSPAASLPPAAPTARVSIQQLHDALERFDADTFRTVALQLHCRKASASASASAGEASGHELCLQPQHGSTLTVRTRTDAITGRVHLPVSTVLTDTNDANHATVLPRGQFLLESLAQSLRFAHFTQETEIRVTLFQTSDNTPGPLHLQFSLRSVGQVGVWLPPVVDASSAGGSPSSSASESE